MRILVTGSRDWTDAARIREEFEQLAANHSNIEMCHGGAGGADALAAREAYLLGWPIKVFPADWRHLGKRAGVVRNQQMLDEFRPDLVLAFPLPQSIGTIDMMRRAEKAGVPILDCSLPQLSLGVGWSERSSP